MPHSFATRRSGAIVAASLLALFAACVDLTPPGRVPPTGSGPVITLDKTQYHWTTDEVFRFTAANPDGVPIWSRCPSMTVQRYRNGWQNVISIPTECFTPLPTQILPGDSSTGTIPLTSNVIPGAAYYRVVFNFFRNQELTDPWPIEHRVSPTFRVDP